MSENKTAKTPTDGGAAFPVAHSYLIQPGMSLRDYFAAKASEKDIEYWMPKGFTETVIQRDPNGKCYEIRQVATWTREQARYRYADAMLKAREL
jgi:hypothetical protein